MEFNQMKKKVCAASRAVRNTQELPIIRALHQFGPSPRYIKPFRLFLDDTRNPPLHEKNWVVVRNVEDAIRCLFVYGKFITEASLDNDLGSGPEGIEVARWMTKSAAWIYNCKTVTIHSGNLRRVKDMREEFRNSPFKVKRRVPHNRVFPPAARDPRDVTAYTGGD